MLARLKLSSLAFVPLPKWVLVGHQMRLLSLLNLHLMRAAATPTRLRKCTRKSNTSQPPTHRFSTLRQVQWDVFWPHTRGHITICLPKSRTFCHHPTPSAAPSACEHLEQISQPQSFLICRTVCRDGSWIYGHYPCTYMAKIGAYSGAQLSDYSDWFLILISYILQ